MDSGQAEGVDILLKSTLDTLGVPVERLKFSGAADTYIIFHLINADESEHADDEPLTHEHQYRIDFYAKGNYTALVRQARKALRAAGFYDNSVNAEFFESSTGYNRISLNSFYLEVLPCE